MPVLPSWGRLLQEAAPRLFSRNPELCQELRSKLAYNFALHNSTIAAALVVYFRSRQVRAPEDQRLGRRTSEGQSID